MELVTLREILKDTREKKYAVPNFNVFNIEMLQGVLKAAQELRSPVIIAYGEGFRDVMKVEDFPGIIKTVGAKYTVPVCIHLDHAFSFELIERAVPCGFTSVMIDASDKSFEDNIEVTKKVVELCAPRGISVESELGHVSGLGDLVENDAHVYTEVDTAERFTEETGIDALAVSIGTAHGVYKEVPRLSIERLKELAARISLPLVLHGGSGLTDGQFRECVREGISKVNIHTDLAMAAKREIERYISEEGYLDLCTLAQEGVYEEAAKKIMLFGSDNKA